MVAAVRLPWRVIVVIVVAIAAVALLGFVLPRVIDYDAFRDAILNISWPWLLALGAVTVVNVITFAPPLMAALPGISFRPALAVTLASTASTYLAPGGAAIGMAFTFAMLRVSGFRGRRATLAVALNSIWNLFTTFGFPAVAITLLTVEGGTHPALKTAALTGLAVFAVIVGFFGLALRSPRQARAIGDATSGIVSRLLRIVRRGPVGWSGEEFVAFRHDAITLLRRRWHWITVATLAGHLTVYLVLVVTLHAVGIGFEQVSLAESFAAWSIVRVLAALPLLPGGFGLVEVGLTGTLLTFGGGYGEVIAAVLVYRALTIVPPVAVGALLAATWRRRNPSWQELAGTG